MHSYKATEITRPESLGQKKKKQFHFEMGCSNPDTDTVSYTAGELKQQ